MNSKLSSPNSQCVSLSHSKIPSSCVLLPMRSSISIPVFFLRQNTRGGVVFEFFVRVCFCKLRPPEIHSFRAIRTLFLILLFLFVLASSERSCAFWTAFFKQEEEEKRMCGFQKHQKTEDRSNSKL